MKLKQRDLATAVITVLLLAGGCGEPDGPYDFETDLRPLKGGCAECTGNFQVNSGSSRVSITIAEEFVGYEIAAARIDSIYSDGREASTEISGNALRAAALDTPPGEETSEYMLSVDFGREAPIEADILFDFRGVTEGPFDTRDPLKLIVP